MADPLIIADHTVLSRIGVGAYGEVWLARNVMGVHRAVKVLWRERFEGTRSYEREFSGLKQFEPISRSHEGLVDILQVGREEGADAGFFYYVMELADNAIPCEGPVTPESYSPLTLQERIRQLGRLPVSECLRIGASVAEALDFLHGQGLVHRDVKPSNIVYVGGQPKLADIGLVARLGDAKSFVGTEGFIAPEGPGTPAADLFSLGKVLYEMATGRNRLDFPEIPEDLSIGDDGGAFAELNDVLLRACAPEAADRHATAAELRSELLLLSAGRSVRQFRRNERLMATWRRVGVAALLLALGVTGALVFERERVRSARAAMEAEASLHRAIERGEAAARQNLYAADMNLAQQALDAGNYGRAEALLSAYGARPGPADLRGIEWFHLWHRLRGDGVAVFRGHEEVVSSLVLSRDGQRLYSASFDSTIREWSLAEQRELQRWHRPGSLFIALALDPSGTRLAGAGENRPFSLLLDLGTGVWLTNPSSASTGIAFAPEGDRLLRGANSMLFETHGRTEITDLRFNVERVLPESGGRSVFAPGGKLLATGSWGGAIRLWSWPELELVGTLPEAGTVMGMDFSPDGGRLASVSREGHLCVWDVAGRRRLAERTVHGGSLVWSVAFSPDGGRLATGGNDQTVRTWDADALREDRVFRGHGGEVWEVIWTADGSRLISAGKDATIRVWTTVRAPRVPEMPDILRAAVFSPDERWIAARSRDGVARVWETDTGREVLRMESVSELGGFAADGRTLAVLSDDFVFERRSVIEGGKILEHKALSRLTGSFIRRLLSADGRWLVTGLSDGEVFVHDIRTGEPPFRLLGHREMVVSLAVSPDGRLLLTGCIDRTARLWDLDRRALVHVFAEHSMGVGSVAFSADGSKIATGSWDDAVRVWDTVSKAKVSVFGAHLAGVQAVGFAPDNRTLASLNGASVLTFWSLAAQREAGVLALPPGTGQGWITVSPKGRWIAAVSQGEVLTLIPAPRDGIRVSR